MKQRIRPPGTDPKEITGFYKRVCEEINKTQRGEVTLTASSATTTVTDVNARTNSSIVPFPLTANAQADFIAGMRISTRLNGSFVITHPNNANDDKTFMYIIQN